MDYEHYLRQNRLPQWDQDDPEALAVRNRHRSYLSEYFEEGRPEDAQRDPYGTAEADAGTVANSLLGVIHQAVYLLTRQLASQEKAFLGEGGFAERIYHHRRGSRGCQAGPFDLSDGSDESDKNPPLHP